MLHPQARALLQLIEDRGLPATHQLTPPQARQSYRDRRHFTQAEPPAVDSVQDLVADGPGGRIPLRRYRPAGAGGQPLPGLVYYHGGGWVIGDLDTHDTLCRQLANRAGCVVVAVDYRMGPEHPFPAAVDDAFAALRAVAARADELGIDAGRLAVGGDSAGGNLAAVTALRARDERGPALKFQLLIYPATDQRRTAESHRTRAEGYLLTHDTIAWFHDHYIDRAEHDLDWRASPLLHPDLRNLPPALVITAGYDPLRDEGLHYAQRLTEAGNRADLVNFERQIHGFVNMGRVLDEADTAVDLCASQLRRAFAR